MRKRINLPVNKLIQQPSKQPKTPADKQPTTKPVTFQQLFQQARQHHQIHSQSAHEHHAIPFPSHHTSQHHSDSIKTTGHTPQNTNRSRKDFQKLNRSLQTKNNSQEKQKKGRSFSNQKKNVSSFLHKHQQSPRLLKQKSNNYIKAQPSPQKQNSHQQFKLQFNNFMNQLDHTTHSHLRQTECFLSIDETFKLMKQLHYLRKIQDEKYLVKLWQELQGDTYGGIPSQNLFQFLTFVNHYDSSDFFPNSQSSSQQNHKKILINSNLKIVADQKAKLQIYEQYLTLRVNRILYGGGDADYQSSQKKLKRTSNIKILDDSQFDSSQKKKKPIQQGKRLSFAKKVTTGTSQHQVANGSNARRSVRLRTNSAKVQQPRQEDYISMEKDKSEETICYSQISQTKESGKNLTSNQSDISLHNSEGNEDLMQQKKPILSIDVNLGQGISQKLLVYEGESALEVSRRLVQKYNIDESLRVKFEAMLNGHIRNLLWRIEEVSEELTSDREE